MWDEVRFSDLMFVPLRNGVYKPKEHHGRGVKIVNMGELFAHDFIGRQEMRRLQLTVSEQEKSLLRPGDLLYARRSLVLEGAGHCSLVSALPEPTTFESSLIRVRLDPDVAQPRFYFYFFRSPQGRAKLASIASRTAVSGITGSDLAALRVPRPPIAAQHRIASILSAYDDLVENNTRRIATLEEMARAIYEEWFVRFRFPGHEGVRMVESELGLVPEGWHVATVATIADRIGATISPGAFPEELFEHYSIPAFDAERRAVLEPGHGIMSNKTHLKDEAVLVSKLNPRIPRIWSVSGCSTRRRVCSTEFIPFVPRPPYTGRLLYLFFNSAWFQERYLGLAVGTSTSHQRVKPADTEMIEVIVPTERVASMADELLAPLLSLADNLRLTIVNLRATRDRLLPKLISGDLDVSAMLEAEALAA
jgi:type I restriction enzyme S subunit